MTNVIALVKLLPEIGLFALILALGFCVLQISSCWQALRLAKQQPLELSDVRTPFSMLLLRFSAVVSLVPSFLISVAFLILLHAFIEDDFSVQVVLEHSHSALVWIYKIGALWSGHSGSWLFWLWLFNGWLVLFSVRSRPSRCAYQLPPAFRTSVLGFLGLINLLGLIFLLVFNNPFARQWPIPIDGFDLNPLLQDQGLLIHPPLLYIGSIGLAIPFAMVCSVGLGYESPNRVAQWMRPWVLGCFAFLSVGIGLGSWWAYRELGWGGWWFWDPVENASLWPWLMSIALIHTLMVLHKRSQATGFNLFLGISAFGSHVLGLFLVRSGILQSVHTFAVDPKRGLFLLGVVVLLWGGGLLWLYHSRFNNEAQSLRKHMLIDYRSREAVMIVSMSLLVVATGTILFGTLFPLFYEVIFHQKITVGFPYFNKVFIPLTLPVLALLPLGPFMQWGHQPVRLLFLSLKKTAFLSVCLGFGLPMLVHDAYSTGGTTLLFSTALSLGFWVLLGTFKVFLKKINYQWSHIQHLSWGAWGMLVAHAGAGVLLIGISILSRYQIDCDILIKPGQSIPFAGRTLLFKDLKTVSGSNYVSHQAHFVIASIAKHFPLRNDWLGAKKTIDLWPEKRVFIVRSTRMTEAAIHSTFLSDTYIALGELLKDGYWSVRLCYKPFMQWVWAGILMMGIGGFCSMYGRRLKS